MIENPKDLIEINSMFHQDHHDFHNKPDFNVENFYEAFENSL